MGWSWLSFFVGNLTGALILFLLLGAFEIAGRNDEIQPAIPEKKPAEKRG